MQISWELIQQDWVDRARDVCEVAQNEFNTDLSALIILSGLLVDGIQALTSGLLLLNLFYFIFIAESAM